MKKILTLFIAALVVNASFAQTSQEESKRVILGKQKDKSSDNKEPRTAKDVIFGKKDGTVSNDGGSRDAEISRINSEYDAKIQSIRNNPNLSAEEKERIIKGLNNERARKIREVNSDYKKNRDSRDRDDDDDDDDRDGKKEKKDKKYKDKNNNGKKLGWEKGVGNPHRSDSDKQTGKNKNKSKSKGKKD